MPSQTVIVAGTVLALSNRSGVSRRDPENPRPYSIDTARVLVADHGIAEVTIPETLTKPGKGESVELVCDADVYNGQVQLRAIAA